VALLVLGLSTLGVQLQKAYDAARDSHRMLRAMNLAESKLAELQVGLIQDVDSAIEDDLEEEFGPLFPDFAWRLRIEPTETELLWAVRLDILYQQREYVEEEEFDFEEAEVLLTLRTLRATPVTIDPATDFGADEEAMQQLTDALAGTEIDPYSIDLRQIAGLPLDQLVELLAAFEEAGLLEGINLGSLLPPEILSLLEEAQGDAGTNGPDEGAPEEVR